MKAKRIIGFVAALLACALAVAGCAKEPEPLIVPAADEAQGAVYDAVLQSWYETLADAFAGAQAGSALYVYRDLEAGALVSDAALFIDLQGHMLSIDITGSGARGGEGLAHSALSFGTGAYTIANGTIEVRLGARPETTQSAASSYQGILTGAGSSLALSTVHLTVSYEGTTAVAPAAKVYGVEAGGSLDMRDGSVMTVRSAPAAGAFGAVTVAGVHATGTGSEAVVTLSPDSSITVSNISAQVSRGAIGYPSTIYGTTKESNAELIEVEIDPSVEWYDDLCRRFLVHAQLDDRSDGNGYVYGAEVYYAPALELANGLKLWVFSNPVSAAGIGHAESVRPDHAFARSDYVLPLDAYGIWCDEDFAGSVVQEGAITASTALGHAVGVYEAASGTYATDEAVITATCATGSFRTSIGAFDLGDFIDLPVATDVDVAYPRKTTHIAIRREHSVAWKTAAQGSERWSYETAPVPFFELFSDWDTLGHVEEEESTEEETIGMTLVYYRMTKDGSYLYTSLDTGKYIYGPDLDLMYYANGYTTPGDTVEIGGVELVFKGWSTRVSDLEPLYIDRISIEKENWGSFGATLVLYGIYERVQVPATEPEPSSQVTPAEPSPAGNVVPNTTPSNGVREADPFSPAGGIGVLIAFAVLVAAFCVFWRVRGQRLSTVADAQAPADGGADAGDGTSRFASERQRRNGGLMF